MSRALVSGAGLLAAAICALFFAARPQPAQATHLCGDTGSPLGPFGIETYEAADWRNAYSRVLELAGFNQLFPEQAGFTLPPLEGGPRAAGSGQLAAPYIPPVLLKAIGWLESSWVQADWSVPYGSVGPVLVSHDCGYGIMQVTSGMQNISGVPNLDQAMIGGHYAFNVARGARILADKWNLAPEYRPLVGDRNPAILEDWYYAIWGYNGFAYKNHPLNPSYSLARLPYSCGPANDGLGHDRSQYPYQELVLGCVAHSPQPGAGALWNPTEVHLPNLSDPAFVAPLSQGNWGPCALSLQCAAMDMPRPNPWHSDSTTPAMNRAQAIGSPVLSLSAGSLTLVAPPGGQSTTATITVANAGTGVLAWKLSTSAPWVRLSRLQGVSLGQDLGQRTQSFSVSADATSLLPGNYSAEIRVESLYAAGAPTVVTVTLRSADGTLLGGNGDPVYVLQGGLKRWVPDPVTFESYGFNWQDVVPLPRDWLTGIPAGQPLPSVLATGRLLRPPGDQVPVYVMDGGTKRYIVSPDVLSQCGYGWDVVRVVSAAALDSIPSGPPLTTPPCPHPLFANATLLQSSDGRVWVTYMNMRRWITGPGALMDCAYRWGDVNYGLGDNLLAPLLAGPDLSGCSKDGSLLWAADGKLFTVRGGLLRYIPDPATFETSGFDGSEIAPMGPNMSLPVGEPIPSVLATGRLIRPPGDVVPIYAMDGGVRRHIIGPDAFAACGYNWATVAILSGATVDSFPEGPPIAGPPCPSLTFAPGTMLQGPDGAVWLTVGPSRRWITGPEALAGCGYQPGNVNPMPDALLTELVIGQPVTSCTADGSLVSTRDDRIYVVKGGWKRYVPNPATFEANDFSSSLVTPVPYGWLPMGKPLLDVIATGRLIRPPGDQVPIYVMDAGAKRHIISPAVLQSCGYTGDAVTLLSDATVAALATGAPLTGQPCPQPSFPEGTLLRGSDGKVWVISSGQRRWITGPDVFNACGYVWANVDTVADSIINAVPAGADLSAPPCP